MSRKILLKSDKSLKINKRKNFEIKFYEGLLEYHPNFIDVLIPLGDVYTRKGFYKEGLAVDEKLTQLLPNDPIVYYNLACSLSLTSQLEQALIKLKKAVLLGYDEFSFMSQDSDLENVRKLSEYKIFFSKLKRLRNKKHE
ncbi:MAG: hypothetical protein KAS05_00155 [Candidatus Omnitrophica bacterium]|nr:hypothetical protein [Candidatus Omnitrophota bacterium]